MAMKKAGAFKASQKPPKALAEAEAARRVVKKAAVAESEAYTADNRTDPLVGF